MTTFASILQGSQISSLLEQAGHRLEKYHGRLDKHSTQSPADKSASYQEMAITILFLVQWIKHLFKITDSRKNCLCQTPEPTVTAKKDKTGSFVLETYGEFELFIGAGIIKSC